MITINRDFTYNTETIRKYYYELKRYDSKNLKLRDVIDRINEKYNNKSPFSSVSKKLLGLRFYGFVIDIDGMFKLNPFYSKYIDALDRNEDIKSIFIDLTLSSTHNYFDNLDINYFDLLYTLLNNKDLKYLDCIDIITEIKNYNGDYDLLVSKIVSLHNMVFEDKIKYIENFYSNEFGKIANYAHNTNYLFSFLTEHGFNLSINSRLSKDYYQVNTKRILYDTRITLDEELAGITNGFSREELLLEQEYNSDISLKGYSETELEEKAMSKYIVKSDNSTKSFSRRYRTDRKLRNTALMYSDFMCGIGSLKNEIHTTFISKSNSHQYAEVHHLVPIHSQENPIFIKGSKYISLDQISNLITLCPICHAKLHYGEDKEVSDDLKLLYDNRRLELKNDGIDITFEELKSFYK